MARVHKGAVPKRRPRRALRLPDLHGIRRERVLREFGRRRQRSDASALVTTATAIVARLGSSSQVSDALSGPALATVAPANPSNASTAA